MKADAVRPRIDPSAFLARGVIVLGDVEVGRDASLWYNTVARGDIERIVIGPESNIQDLTTIHTDTGLPCLIGQRVSVGHRAILHGCVIEDDCLIGMGAILLNGVRIGRGSIVGAGAVLLEGTEVPPGSIVLGLPGRVARPVDDAGRARIDRTWRRYIDQVRHHREGRYPVAPTIEGDA